MDTLPDHHHLKQQLHFVLVPLMVPGHFIPMLDIAVLLAERGPMVTVITTGEIASRFAPKLDRAVQAGHRIKVLEIKFPAVECGLPEGTGTIEGALGTQDSMVRFFFGMQKMQQSFKDLFRGIKPRPSCLIIDKHIHWSNEFAREFDVTRIDYDVMGCFSIVLSHCLQSLYETLPESDSEPFVVPGLPHAIQLNKSQIPFWCDPNHIVSKKLIESAREAFGVAVNSFQELESGYDEECIKWKGGQKVWCIGPLSVTNKDSKDKAQRGGGGNIDDNQCLKWLDTHEPGSVVYACLGSMTGLTVPQLAELGLGLEATTRPFIWVMRGGNREEEVDKWMKDGGFEERTKGRGLVIRGWAPQVLILSHPAIGAFLTHCGWNSSIEGVSAGVPMITWPMNSEQFFNEKFLVDVVRGGVSVGAQFAVPLCEEDKFGVSVKRDAITDAVEQVMDGGVEGEERRKRLIMLANMTKTVTEQGGSSYLNLSLLIQDVANEIQRKENGLRSSASS